MFYAAATASNVAYTTYIYAQVPQEKFQLVTGFTQAAALTGAGLGHFLGQILISTELCDYSNINYVSLAFVAAATTVACCLPSASQSIYFHRTKTPAIAQASAAGNNEPGSQAEDVKQQQTPSAWLFLWEDFKSAYSNIYMLKWSVWCAIATSGNLLVITYIQALWNTVNFSGTFTILNGEYDLCNSATCNPHLTVLFLQVLLRPLTPLWVTCVNTLKHIQPLLTELVV